MSEIRDHIHAGRRQAEWEEATGRVDHGLWSRGRVGGWHGRLTEDDDPYDDRIPHDDGDD